MTRPSVVFIGAHPDDIVRCVGTLFLLKEKYQIHDFCICSGQRGYPVGTKGYASLNYPPRADVGEERIREEEQVCRMLDAKLKVFNEIDGEIYAHSGICGEVAQALAEIKPTAIFTHWALEKPDHSAVSKITRRAMHLADIFWTTELYMPIHGSECFKMPQPDIYVNITTVIEKKLDVVRIYQRQLGNDAPERTRQQNRHYGMQTQCEYAESFISGLPQIGTRWDTKTSSILLNL